MAGRVLEAVILYYCIIKWGGEGAERDGREGREGREGRVGGERAGEGQESKEKERVRAPMSGC